MGDRPVPVSAGPAALSAGSERPRPSLAGLRHFLLLELFVRRLRHRSKVALT